MSSNDLHVRPDPAARRPRLSRWTIAALMVAVIVLFYLLREHWAHALGLAPYALLLACPLMHLFHGGHAGHGHHGRSPAAPRNDEAQR